MSSTLLSKDKRHNTRPRARPERAHTCIPRNACERPLNTPSTSPPSSRDRTPSHTPISLRTSTDDGASEYTRGSGEPRPRAVSREGGGRASISPTDGLRRRRRWLALSSSSAPLLCLPWSLLPPPAAAVATAPAVAAKSWARRQARVHPTIPPPTTSTSWS